ncbi:MAG: uroporphyrinogen decarboxylase family protein [Bryobacter sp.]|nr:uroporphyrinogen decarboxylase family protein [Bryobacter sp.]
MNEFQAAARDGLRMPIGTDLVLHEHADAEAIRLDGARLGRVVAESADRWRAPLGVPLMDLRLEKADVLAACGLPEHERESYVFRDDPGSVSLAGRPYLPAQEAQIEAVRWVARNTGLLPMGMAIGPFSLLTRLMADPITPVALASRGMTAADEPLIGLAESLQTVALDAVLRGVRAQLEAGARAVIICEPAAGIAYLSPRLLEKSNALERWVLSPNRRVRELLASAGAALVFHDCAELTPGMVSAFARELRPAMLSLGSSRKLWEDSSLVDRDIVLYGNLPTKLFYSDAAMPTEEVERRTKELIHAMRACGHPHILGSECDVLHVPGSEETIRRKVRMMCEVAA